MGGTRRLVIVLVAGLTFSLLGAAVIEKQEKGAEKRVVASAVATTTTVVPTTTTTAVAVTRPLRPVAAPREEYAPEQIVEIGTIEIPRIGLSHRVMHGISMRNIDLGPSHWPGTAMPGENGNAVFAGHRVTHTHPFRNIDQLVSGDQVIFRINGLKSTYSVTGSEVVFPDALRITDQTVEPTATLFACHPPHSARQRYVVHLALVESVPDV
ncbi:MAG TPA: class E sortase [Acidimicrobiales bacterium]|nr:class E sortase [Acidimicrobiales bacterium]